MNEREAMKLALEALEVATTPLARDRQKVLAAFTALRAALIAAEKDKEIERLREALHRISLASHNSMSSKDECGRIARAALQEQPR